MNEFHRRVQRALELQQKMSKANAEMEEMKKEYQLLMSDPYLCDKVNGLKTGGIL
jgi:hypothetical protein